MQKVVFILGATGTGKSDMAVSLAKKFSGEVISCDAVQVFKGFDVGSAKITKDEMQGVRHYLIDECSANDYFSVSDFVERAKEAINDISSRGKLPIVVGGTGLYVNALINGFNFGGTQRNEEFRNTLELRIEKEGFENVYQELAEFNPALAAKVNANNVKRLIRAFEIAKFGQVQERKEPEYDHLIFALTMPREVLYERLNLRAQKIVKNGLVDEVKALLKAGAKRDCQPMKAIGYKEVLPYLDGEISKDEMEKLIAQHTRNYAKRQMTYLRSMEKTNKIEYVDVSQANAKIYIENRIKEWLC